MKALCEAVAHIAMEVHPERIDAICSALSASSGANILAAVKNGLGSAFSSRLMNDFEGALRTFPLPQGKPEGCLTVLLRIHRI